MGMLIIFTVLVTVTPPLKKILKCMISKVPHTLAFICHTSKAVDKNKLDNTKNHFAAQQHKQVAELSQRDRAAGWVSYSQKCKTVNGRQYFRTL